RLAGEPACENRSETLVGTLGEHHIRLEAAELTGDHERQPEVEEGPVERLRADVGDEDEGCVFPITAGGAASDHTEIDYFRESVELGAQARVERKPVAGPSDHQDARLHVCVPGMILGAVGWA